MLWGGGETRPVSERMSHPSSLRTSLTRDLALLGAGEGAVSMVVVEEIGAMGSKRLYTVLVPEPFTSPAFDSQRGVNLACLPTRHASL